MRAYSPDLRQRILRAVGQGKPRAEIIQTFAVSRSTIKRYLKLRREAGDVKPRAIPGRPSKKGANITLLASLSLQGMGEAFILEGSADGAVFGLYIEQILAPSLQSGQIVILDNLNTHTGARIRPG